MRYKKIPIKKKWGQNFLIDPNTINKIISIINSKKSTTIIEIGPGKGALTFKLAKESRLLHAIEIDPLLFEELYKKQNKNIILYNEDILKWKFKHKNIKLPIKIVGNLPYYITSPIIFKFIDESYWDEMIFMVQKEVGDRIVAKHNTKNYSRLSVMCQTFCLVNLELKISKNVFNPKPKVSSAIIKFKRKSNNIPLEKFSTFIKIAFAKRRKTLKNNFKDYIDTNLLGEYSNKRAEQISVQDFRKIFKKIYI